MNDSQAYLTKKAFFNKVLTIYGRHAVLEALADENLTIHKLHLATSNKPSRELEMMVQTARERHIEIAYHDKKALSHISKNSRLDQGVALDVVMENFIDEKAFLAEQERFRVIALDGVTNPQNLGMIIRSCAAGDIDALLLPTRGTASISPLVIQASAGTLFRLPIIKTPDLIRSLERFKAAGAHLYALEAGASTDYRQAGAQRAVYVLGNESEGIAPEVARICTDAIAIPMRRGVESLNVAVTAALIAFA